jgi:hypothetical protein
MSTMSTDSAKIGSPSDYRSVFVLWLAAAVFGASFTGCMLMILLGAQHADVALPTAGGEIMHMPLARASDADIR